MTNKLTLVEFLQLHLHQIHEGSQIASALEKVMYCGLICIHQQTTNSKLN